MYAGVFLLWGRKKVKGKEVNIFVELKEILTEFSQSI